MKQLIRLVALISLFLKTFFVLAQSTIIPPTQEEYEHKAKIIIYIIKNVGWPTGSLPVNSFNLCVLGKLPINEPIKNLNDPICR